MNHKYKRLLVLLLIAAMALTLPVFSASAVDDPMVEAPAEGEAAASTVPLTGLSLTVNKGDVKALPDLANAEVVIDLYLIAKAAPDTGGHGDTYIFETPAVELSKDITKYDNLPKVVPGDAAATSAAAEAFWGPLKKEAAKKVLGGSAVTLSATTKDAGKAFTELAGGLYLAVARGKDLTDLEDYRFTNDDGDVYTIAYSPSYEYQFAPELIAIPDKGNHSTADGTWQKTFTANMKPGQEPRYGDVEILKKVSVPQDNTYLAEGHQVTFVFLVEAKDADNKTVYKDYVSITYPGDSYYIEGKIPAGATVTVTEKYPGAGFRNTSMTEPQKMVLTTAPDDEQEPLTFTAVNTFDNTLIRGFGIENHYAEGDGEWHYQSNEPLK